MKIAVFYTIAITLYLQSLQAQKPIAPVKFRMERIASEAFESVGVFDVNNDGKLELVSGSYWYEAPSFQNRHYMGAIQRVDDYYDDFATIPFDVDRDDKMDVISGGWFGKSLRWRKNPDKEGIWQESHIDSCGNIETIRTWDVDDDGQVEIVPNNPSQQLKCYPSVN